MSDQVQQPKKLKFPPPAGFCNCEVKWYGIDHWQPYHDFLVYSYMDSFGDAKKLFQRMADTGDDIPMHFMFFRYREKEPKEKRED